MKKEAAYVFFHLVCCLCHPMSQLDIKPLWTAKTASGYFNPITGLEQPVQFHTPCRVPVHQTKEFGVWTPSPIYQKALNMLLDCPIKGEQEGFWDRGGLQFKRTTFSSFIRLMLYYGESKTVPNTNLKETMNRLPITFSSCIYLFYTCLLYIRMCACNYRHMPRTHLCKIHCNVCTVYVVSTFAFVSVNVMPCTCYSIYIVTNTLLYVYW